jgi:hypothetical protein
MKARNEGEHAPAVQWAQPELFEARHFGFEEAQRTERSAARRNDRFAFRANSNATMADAPTALSVFADQPRCFVPPRRIDLIDP